MDLTEHAENEIRLAGLFDGRADGSGEFGQKLFDAVKMFAEYSGEKRDAASTMFSRILRFQPLTALTTDPAEWEKVGDNLWKSTRQVDAESTDGGKTYYVISNPKQINHSANHEV